jgi:hypothetical protein
MSARIALLLHHAVAKNNETDVLGDLNHEIKLSPPSLSNVKFEERNKRPALSCEAKCLVNY